MSEILERKLYFGDKAFITVWGLIVWIVVILIIIWLIRRRK